MNQPPVYKQTVADSLTGPLALLKACNRSLDLCAAI